MGCRVTSPDEIAKIEALCIAAGVSVGEVAKIEEPAKGMQTVHTLAALSESAFTAVVIGMAQRHSWRVVHFRPGMNRRGKWMTAGQGDSVGWPDLFLIRGLRIVVAELKVGRNRTTPAQDGWLEAFRAAEIEAYVWKPEDMAEIESVLGSSN